MIKDKEELLANYRIHIYKNKNLTLANCPVSDILPWPVIMCHGITMGY